MSGLPGTGAQPCCFLSRDDDEGMLQHRDRHLSTHAPKEQISFKKEKKKINQTKRNFYKSFSIVCVCFFFLLKGSFDSCFLVIQHGGSSSRFISRYRFS